MLKTIDADLYDWVEYNTRLLENSGIGYRPRTCEAVMMEFGGVRSQSIPGCRVPYLKNASGRIRDIDRVLKVLPDNMLELVRKHYIERSTTTGGSLYRRLDRLHYTIQGALLMR